MGKKVEYTCDLCGKEIVKNSFTNYAIKVDIIIDLIRIISTSNSKNFGATHYLCKDCHKKFDDYIKKFFEVNKEKDKI